MEIKASEALKGIIVYNEREGVICKDNDMNTRFLFKGVEVNALTREYMLKRLERIERLVDKVSLFEIEVGISEHKHFRVEVMIKTPHHLYRAEETSETAEGSMDIVVDKLERQVVADTKRQEDLRRSGGREIKHRLQSEE